MPTLRTLANVNVGLTANDGTGDLIRTSFTKINSNFNGLYNNGQFVSFSPDTKLVPGYTWQNDRDTGMYRPASGKIAFSLNGNESLVLSEDATIRWFGSELATKGYVDNQLAGVLGGGGGGAGLNGVAITLVDPDGNTIGETTSYINGIPVVSELPTSGNFEGRFAYYNGDVWIYSCYPAGNGINLPADPSIARAAGSDCRWKRFRGEGAVTTGTSLPTAGFEGQVFYNATNNTLYYYLQGQWKTAAAVVVPDAPSGFEVLQALPARTDPANFDGKTVVVGDVVYIYRGNVPNGNWIDLRQYVSGGTTSAIPSVAVIPSTTGRQIGELIRKTGDNAGLYAFNGSAWVTLATYTRDIGATAGIKRYNSLPASSASFSAGDLIIVPTGGVDEIYILSADKTRWDLFRPGGGSGSVVAVQVSANSIGTDELKSRSITSDKIVTGEITGELLAANTITAENIATGTITAAQIRTGTIGADQINASSIAAAIIATGEITAGVGNFGSVTAEQIEVDNLAAITTNMGTITAGILKSPDNKMVIDLNNKFIRIEL